MNTYDYLEFPLERTRSRSRKHLSGVKSKAVRRMIERLHARQKSSPVAKGFKTPGSQKRRS